MSDPDTCAFNELALVEVDPADASRVNPSVPGFGGPTGVGDLAKELAYMRAHSAFADMQLAHGTEPFKPNLVEAILGA